MGFAYTEFMTESDFEREYKKADRHIVLCKYLIVPDGTEDYYSQFMTRVTDGLAAKKSLFDQSVIDRREMCCEEFNYSSDGFEAKIALDSPNVVYFSVPYEENGWSATVNGKEAEVLKVTYGFVAVECEAGENIISFDYSTPGFAVPCKLTVGETEFEMPAGIYWSLGASVVFVLYMLYFIVIKKHKTKYKFFGFDYYDNCGYDIKEKQIAVLTEEKVSDSTLIDEEDTLIDEEDALIDEEDVTEDDASDNSVE